MSKEKAKQYPPKLVSRLYSWLAYGRYASEWLPEFLIRYEQILDENGEEQALEWAMQELLATLRPAAAARIYRFVRLIHLAWKLYNKFS